MGLQAGLALGPILSSTRAHGLYLLPSVGAELLLQDLGIPGRSAGAHAQLELGYEFGALTPYRSTDPQRRPLRSNTVAYYVVWYFETDSTSQLSGGLRYERVGAASSFDVQFENDALAFQLLDRYRTFALRARYLRRGTAGTMGAGLRVVVWTGTTEGLGFLSRGESYDLTGQHGGEYPHGILALDLYRDGLTLSVGYDSERIRSAFQNSFHYLIDDGYIPRQDRPGALFLRIALNEGGTLY